MKKQKPVKKTNSSKRKPNTLISSGKNNIASKIEVEKARGRDLDLKISPMDKANVNPKKQLKKSSKTINPPKTVDNVSFERASELTQRMKRNAEWGVKMDAKPKSTATTAPKTLKSKKKIIKLNKNSAKSIK